MSKPNRKLDKHDDNDEDPGRGKPWLALLIIVLLASVVAWFWLARDPESRAELAQRFKSFDSVSSALQSVASSAQNIATALKDRFVGPPPVPEVGATSGSSLPGAPPKTRGPIETQEDLDKALAEIGEPLEGGAVERGPVAPLETQTVPADAGRKDDAVVRTVFVDDLASWLVKNYTPPKTKDRAGQVSANLQTANLRYGVGMKGLAWIGDDLSVGRNTALDYIYTPAMLDALYRLYITRFMGAVHAALETSDEKASSFSVTQKEDFYAAYARRFRGISGALQGVAALPDFSRKMTELKNTAQKVVDANALYSELVFMHDQAREQGDIAKTETLRHRMDAASHAYRKAVLAREQSREAFALLVKNNPAARTLDDDSLLYVASWVERRVHNAPNKMDATLQAATLFLDLAQHFETAERNLHKTPTQPAQNEVTIPQNQTQSGQVTPQNRISATPSQQPPLVQHPMPNAPPVRLPLPAPPAPSGENRAN